MADNAAIVRRGFEEVWNQGKLNVVDEINAPDFIGHNEGRPDDHGLAEFKRFVADTRTAFPDLHFTINELIVQGDSVAAGTTVTGTHTGPLVGRGDMPSIPPTSKSVSLMVSVLFHLRDGKIAETWAVVDNLSLLQQLGVIPTALASAGTQPQPQTQQPPM
jgi:steroid delta-isomerase-like uncharacterized protein